MAAKKVKDAVVDQLRSLTGERPSVDPIHPDVRINVYLHDQEATISIDLSGESLHKRGYRQESTEAPLKENLAAAILMLSGWPTTERIDLLDPMCGSGTLPIEAALMACKIAPGFKRTFFGFTGWRGHNPNLWQRVIEEAKDHVIRDHKNLPHIMGYDKDPQAIRVASSKLKRGRPSPHC